MTRGSPTTPGRAALAWLRAGSRGSVLAVLVLSAPLLLQCRRSSSRAGAGPPPPSPLVLSVVDVRAAPPDNGTSLPLDTAALSALIRRRMESSGLVKPSPATPEDPPPGQLRIAGRVAIEIVEVADKGKLESSVSLRLDTRPSDAPGAINEELAASGERVFAIASGIDRAALGQQTMERTLSDLLDGFLGRMHLQTASPEELHALIRKEGPLREDALRQVGQRQLKDEVPYLLELLHHDTESVRDAALGALLALHEQRAVRELTHSRSMQDRREMRKILDAISTLGGEEARDYLNFVAEGHTDEEIRAMAAEARDRLERRQDAGG